MERRRSVVRGLCLVFVLVLASSVICGRIAASATAAERLSAVLAAAAFLDETAVAAVEAPEAGADSVASAGGAKSHCQPGIMPCPAQPAPMRTFASLARVGDSRLPPTRDVPPLLDPPRLQLV